MIRINLLPVRAAKKKESMRIQLSIAGLVTFLVLAVVGVVYWTVSSDVKALRADINEGKTELASLKAKIGELSRIKEQKRVVEEKLGIIRSLDARRTGPTELFLSISESIPEKAWIETLTDRGNTVVLEGYAASDDVVADFMRGLGKHRQLGLVELEVAQRVREKETGSDVVNFIIRLDRVR